jgi:hypothetical protein
MQSADFLLILMGLTNDWDGLSLQLANVGDYIGGFRVTALLQLA